MSQVIHSTVSSFEEDVMEQPLPVLVDFWAEWCGPCKAMSPALDEIARERLGSWKIVKVDVDEHSGLGEKFGVRSLPTVFIIRDGEVLGQHVGPASKAQLETLMAEHTGS